MTSFEQFGHWMAATAALRLLDMCQTPQQTAEVNAFENVLSIQLCNIMFKCFEHTVTN